ncbi:hypothetical protein [Martelella sp. AMO21009]
MHDHDTFRSAENNDLEAMVTPDELLDLIEIALQLAMRLGLATTASHLFMACDTLGPAETEAQQWGGNSRTGNAEGPSRNASDG